MRFEETRLHDACLIHVDRHTDGRGHFARTMCVDQFAAHGMVSEFVQQNTSYTAHAGTVRGMHFQRHPFSEAKLVRCIRGAIFDVIVDLRESSPSYLGTQSFLLEAETGDQLYIPPGFAHGFQTLVDDVEVTYLMSAPFHAEAQAGLRFDDPTLDIIWPLPPVLVSERDLAWPALHSNALSAS
jgi:dTDP-4-dehydrorhamnose 3,5-epimerase